MVIRSARRASRSAVGVALVFGLAACSAPDVPPTGIPSTAPSAGPSATASGEWGAYGDRDDACAAVAGDVLTLALAPKNLALADPGSGVDDIDDTIRTAAAAAPPAIAPNYAQLSAIVQAFGRELTAWDDAVQAASGSATAAARPAAAPVSGGGAGGSATASPLPASPAPASPAPASPAPERPAFVDTSFTAQLERIKAWLNDTCG